jgi:hypothetical protein
MAAKQHPDYNKAAFPKFVCAHGNWDIYANANGYCAAIPSVQGEAAGCSASHFGDMAYVKMTLAKELAAAQAEKLATAQEAVAA